MSSSPLNKNETPKVSFSGPELPIGLLYTFTLKSQQATIEASFQQLCKNTCETGFSESCVFSQLFANVQGFHLSCLRASFSSGPKYNYYFFANCFLNSSIDHLYKHQTKKRRQKSVLSWSLCSCRAQQHVSRKRGNGSAVSCWCVDRSRRSQLRDKQRLKSWRWWIPHSIR